MIKTWMQAGINCTVTMPVLHCLTQYKNSSGDEIANVNFLRRYGTYVLQNTKKREPTSFNRLDDS